MTDFLGLIFTALSIALPIILFLMKSFADQISPERVLEHEAGSEAWEIAMVDAEEGIVSWNWDFGDGATSTDETLHTVTKNTETTQLS